MAQQQRNILFIVSDQHNSKMTGYSGHPNVVTPALDSLAQRGTVFSSAYCASPICVPSRASLATGRYVHELATWDNAAPYTGSVPSWGHYLGSAGYHVTTIGKLHYRNTDDDTGFPDQRLAMHVHEGGDLRGVSRRAEGGIPPPGDGLGVLLNVASGESEYNRYDRAIARSAADFLTDESDGGPWALMVSFVAPHFPLIAPSEHFDNVSAAGLQLSPVDSGAWDHPAVDVFREAFGLSRLLTESEQREVLHAYLALCGFLDERISEVLDSLAQSGHAQDTLVLYTSDHGESSGAHGQWFKHLMNEESVRVPFVVAGPGVPVGTVVDTPVSHVDIFPTFLDWAGLSRPADARPGLSVLNVGTLAEADRPVLAEYHANGSINASFMLRHGRYKYIEYVGERPQLFNLDSDPEEMVNLATDPDHKRALEECARRLREICNPSAVDARAKADQARRVAEVGGVEAADALRIPYTPIPSGFD